MHSTRPEISDTVTVLSNGRAVVDVKRFHEKKHIREMMRRMAAKVHFVPRSARPQPLTLPLE